MSGKASRPKNGDNVLLLRVNELLGFEDLENLGQTAKNNR